MKTKLNTISGKLNNVEDRISDLEDRITGLTQSEQQTADKWKKKKKGNTDTRYNMDEPWTHYAKWKKPVIKDHKLCII